jgi:hypothetical protein
MRRDCPATTSVEERIDVIPQDTILRFQARAAAEVAAAAQAAAEVRAREVAREVERARRAAEEAAAAVKRARRATKCRQAILTLHLASWRKVITAMRPPHAHGLHAGALH